MNIKDEKQKTKEMMSELRDAREALMDAAKLMRDVGQGKIRPQVASQVSLRFDIAAMSIEETIKRLQ